MDDARRTSATRTTSSRRRWAAIVLALVVVVGVAAFLVQRAPSGGGPAPSSPPTAPTPSSSGFPTSRGVYVVDFFDPPKTADASDLDGFVQSYRWLDVEPAAARFDWSRLNSDLSSIK